jgi:hypothetical protein
MLQLGRFGLAPRDERRQETINVPPETSEQLHHLKSLVDLIDDMEEKFLYTDLARKPQDEFSAYHSLAKDACCISVIFQWPPLLPEEYVKHLMSSDAEAMVVFAYYTVLLSKALPCWVVGRQTRMDPCKHLLTSRRALSSMDTVANGPTCVGS